MAQQLIIANHLNGKLLNTVFIKERRYTFPTLRYLGNFTKSISQYCKEYADLHN